MKSLPASLLSIVVLMWCSLIAAAEDNPVTYDRVDLAVSAQGEALNDVLVAVLFREMEGASAPALAEEVNKSISHAIKRIKQVPEIKLQTLDYQTAPVYQKERVTGWRVRQSIRLESRDIAKLSNLLGELQQQLGLQSIGYSVSPEKLKEVEDHLIREAIKSFQQRADLVTRELGRTRYRIVLVRVETAGPPVQPIRMAARTMAMEATAPVAIETGEQKIQVNVSGTIELQTN